MSIPEDSKKIILVELDIGQEQVIWFNYSGFTYYVDFDAVYDRIDPAFLAGVDPQDIDVVGSVSSDASQLRNAASIAAVEGEENTFFWDAATKRVYIHLNGGDRPSLHRLVIGIVYGIANRGGFYNGTLYEPRLLNAPSISKSRDPLFWGRLSFDSGTITINNADGKFDSWAEDYDIFGNAARILLGFDDEAYSSFRRLYTGTIGTIKIDTDTIEIEVVDSRRYLATKIPDKVYSVDDFPDLKDSREGKSIPIGYGVLRNVPAMCTNEAAGAPASYSFTLFDMTHHLSIHAITTVYVDGVITIPASTDLPTATFTLALADYSPGQEVTVDCEGYEDDLGNLIENALDIITDVIDRWLNIPYSSTAYDQAAWNAARAIAPDLCYYADDPVEINEIIEDISASALGIFLVDRFGRYTFRIINPLAYPVQEIKSYEPLNLPSIEYNPEETIGVAVVKYSKDWAEDDYLTLRDVSRQDEVLERYKVVQEKTFETLLKNKPAAQAFATKVLDEGAYVSRPFSITLKLQNAQRELGDIIQVELTRRGGAAFIGTAKAEVIGIKYDLIEAEQELTCRVIEFVPAAEYYAGADFYGDGFYGDDLYGSGEVA